jgi:hypothetical protein
MGMTSVLELEPTRTKLHVYCNEMNFLAKHDNGTNRARVFGSRQCRMRHLLCSLATPVPSLTFRYGRSTQRSDQARCAPFRTQRLATSWSYAKTSNALLLHAMPALLPALSGNLPARTSADPHHPR